MDQSVSHVKEIREFGKIFRKYGQKSQGSDMGIRPFSVLSGKFHVTFTCIQIILRRPFRLAIGSCVILMLLVLCLLVCYPYCLKRCFSWQQNKNSKFPSI